MEYIKSLGIAVGTGLAFESLFKPTSDRIDNEREIPKIDVKGVEVLYLNLSTVIRNIVETLNKETRDNVFRGGLYKKFYDTFITELYNIDNLALDIDMEIILFHHNFSKEFYNDLTDLKLYPEKITIARQIRDLTNKVYKDYKKDKKLLPIMNVLSTTKKSIMLTHDVMPLALTKKQIPVLESHTGMLIRNNHMDKYYKLVNEMKINAPLNKYLILLIGTKNGVWLGNLKYRREIFKISEKHRWNFKMPEERLIREIKDLVNLVSHLDFKHKEL